MLILLLVLEYETSNMFVSLFQLNDESSEMLVFLLDLNGQLSDVFGALLYLKRQSFDLIVFHRCIANSPLEPLKFNCCLPRYFFFLLNI
jgi:hypothetical protein